MKVHYRFVIAPLVGLIGAPALAAELGLTVELPRLNVAEYHRPYVAIWLEREDRSVAANLSVWYDLKLKNAEGEKWLKDMRLWWRRSGREIDFPVDGVSAPTRPPGRHRLTFATDHAALQGLAPGSYRLMVEAAREVGGREVLELPFHWPPSGTTHVRAGGKSELGTVEAVLEP